MFRGFLFNPPKTSDESGSRGSSRFIGRKFEEANVSVCKKQGLYCIRESECTRWHELMKSIPSTSRWKSSEKHEESAAALADAQFGINGPIMRTSHGVHDLLSPKTMKKCREKRRNEQGS